MMHGHINIYNKDLIKKWNFSALDSFLDRGNRQDMRELSIALSFDSSGLIAKRLLILAIDHDMEKFAKNLIDLSKK